MREICARFAPHAFRIAAGSASAMPLIHAACGGTFICRDVAAAAAALPRHVPAFYATGTPRSGAPSAKRRAARHRRTSSSADPVPMRVPQPAVAWPAHYGVERKPFVAPFPMPAHTLRAQEQQQRARCSNRLINSHSRTRKCLRSGAPADDIMPLLTYETRYCRRCAIARRRYSARPPRRVPRASNAPIPPSTSSVLPKKSAPSAPFRCEREDRRNMMPPRRFLLAAR